MLHLDEGTIHAWLDGELSPEESESAARHVGECAQCRELVTEARGFMAGATRIVSALDAGPAGVVPRASRSAVPLRRPWYRRILTPARMSIAATIVVAVGLSITARRVADNNSIRGRVVERQMNVAQPITASTVSADSVSAAREKQKAGASNLLTKNPSAITAVETNAPLVPAPLTAPSSTAGGTAVAEQKSAAADKKTVADSERRVAAASPPPARAPVARFDSTQAAKDEMAKLAVDSISRARTLARRRAFVSGNVNQLSEVVATGSRDADLRGFLVFPECYRLAIDSTDWRGILPAAFALDPASPTRVAGGSGGMTPVAAGAGAGARAGAAAPKTAAQSAIGLSTQVIAAGSIRALAPSGRVDSVVVGVWSAASRDSITLRFMTDPNKPATLLLGATSSTARVTSGNRTDSVRVARTSCSR